MGLSETGKGEFKEQGEALGDRSWNSGEDCSLPGRAVQCLDATIIQMIKLSTWKRSSQCGEIIVCIGPHRQYNMYVNFENSCTIVLLS